MLQFTHLYFKGLGSVLASATKWRWSTRATFSSRIAHLLNLKFSPILFEFWWKLLDIPSPITSISFIFNKPWFNYRINKLLQIDPWIKGFKRSGQCLNPFCNQVMTLIFRSKNLLPVSASPHHVVKYSSINARITHFPPPISIFSEFCKPQLMQLVFWSIKRGEM